MPLGISDHNTAKTNAFISHIWQDASYRNLKLTFEDLLRRYFYAIQASSRTIRSQVRNVPLQAKKRTWVNCKLIIAWHYIVIWFLCIVSVMPANKQSLQELKQLVGIKLVTSRFLEIFGSLSQFPRGQMPVCPPCGRPWAFPFVISSLSSAACFWRDNAGSKRCLKF